MDGFQRGKKRLGGNSARGRNFSRGKGERCSSDQRYEEGIFLSVSSNKGEPKKGAGKKLPPNKQSEGEESVIYLSVTPPVEGGRKKEGRILYLP